MRSLNTTHYPQNATSKFKTKQQGILKQYKTLELGGGGGVLFQSLLPSGQNLIWDGLIVPSVTICMELFYSGHKLIHSTYIVVNTDPSIATQYKTPKATIRALDRHSEKYCNLTVTPTARKCDVHMSHSLRSHYIGQKQQKVPDPS